MPARAPSPAIDRVVFFSWAHSSRRANRKEELAKSKGTPPPCKFHCVNKQPELSTKVLKLRRQFPTPTPKNSFKKSHIPAKRISFFVRAQMTLDHSPHVGTEPTPSHQTKKRKHAESEHKTSSRKRKKHLDSNHHNAPDTPTKISISKTRSQPHNINVQSPPSSPPVPATLPDSDHDISITDAPPITKDSPFHSATISLYLPIPPIALSQITALPSLLTTHLTPLLLSYYPPLRGIVLAISNPILSSRKPSPDNAPTTTTLSRRRTITNRPSPLRRHRRPILHLADRHLPPLPAPTRRRIGRVGQHLQRRFRWAGLLQLLPGGGGEEQDTPRVEMGGTRRGGGE